MRRLCWLAGTLLAGGILLVLRDAPLTKPGRITNDAGVVAASGRDDAVALRTDTRRIPAESAVAQGLDLAPPPIDETPRTVLAAYPRAALEDRLAALRYLDAAQEWPDAQRAALLDLALQDPVEEMRLAALLAVETGYFAAAFPLLDRALGDPATDVRAFAVDALAASGDPRIVKSLERALFDGQSEVRARVLDNLAALDPEVQQPVLLRALESADDRIATAAIQALWEVVSPEVIPPVLRLLDSPSAARRQATQNFLAALFSTSFTNRTQAENWWAAHHARYDDLLRPISEP